MKKILILGGASMHIKVVKQAKKMGLYTIVTDYIEDSPAKSIADESLMLDIFDVDNIVKYCSENNVDGVLSFCIDPAQKPLLEITEALNMPNFGDLTQTLTLTNKSKFKEYCAENNVDTIKTYSMQDILNCDIEYPILIKPNDSRGSRGVSICYSRNEVDNAIELAEKNSTNGTVIIEKYLEDNQDLTITYIVKDGIPELISIGDRHSGDAKDNLDRQLICTIQPSQHATMYTKYVDSKVKNMIKNLNIKNGPVFMQGFVDGNTVRMYDPGLRFPGNDYETIYSKATNINIIENIINYSLYGTINVEVNQLKGSYDLNGYTAMQYMVNVGAGTVTSIAGLDELKNNPQIINITQCLTVGAKVKCTGDVRHRIFDISILVKRDTEEMKNVIGFINKNLKITDENGKDMIISPFTTEHINYLY